MKHNTALLQLQGIEEVLLVAKLGPGGMVKAKSIILFLLYLIKTESSVGIVTKIGKYSGRVRGALLKGVLQCFVIECFVNDR